VSIALTPISTSAHLEPKAAYVFNGYRHVSQKLWRNTNLVEYGVAKRADESALSAPLVTPPLQAPQQ